MCMWKEKFAIRLEMEFIARIASSSRKIKREAEPAALPSKKTKKVEPELKPTFKIGYGLSKFLKRGKM